MLADQPARHRRRPEQRRGNTLRRRLDLVFGLFVDRQLADETGNNSRIPDDRFADREIPAGLALYLSIHFSHPT